MGKRSIDPETRRILMAAWCRIRCGDDSWRDGWGGIASGAILILLAMFVLGWLTGSTARGDLIVEVDYIDSTVYHESEALVDEIGIGLSGKGRSLGWLVFYQPETFWGVGPAVEFGGWSERYGGSTQQSLQFYADDQGYLRTGLYGDRITGDVGALVAGGYLRPDTQVPVGHTAVYLPFVWSSHADQFGDDEPDTLFQGTGWISLTAFDQTPPAGTPASFRVGEVLLVNAESYVGQTVFSQAVPEPATWGLFVVVCVVAVIYKRGAVMRRAIAAVKKWWLSIRPTYDRLELRCFSFPDADAVLRQTHGCSEFWRLAKEDDANVCFGVVWLEKVKRRTE